MCNDGGGIIDDVFVYRLDDVRFLVVNNASNVDAGREHIKRFVEPGMDVELLDRQASTVMLALQGPGAPAFLTRVIGGEVPQSLPKHKCTELEFGGYKLFVSRTGYTGEDGFELVTSAEAGAHLLTQLAREGVAPCGLGARDTLRLEAALPLYGNDIDMATNPFEAGLGFAVTLDDGAEFSGKAALASAKAAGLTRKLACIKATERGVMRHGYVALHDGKPVATVTSGGFSPVLGTSIGMAYLPVDLAREGVELEIDARGKPLRAVVVKRPFYKRKKA
jgi:aminomethyltransferase